MYIYYLKICFDDLCIWYGLQIDFMCELAFSLKPFSDSFGTKFCIQILVFWSNLIFFKKKLYVLFQVNEHSQKAADNNNLIAQLLKEVTRSFIKCYVYYNASPVFFQSLIFFIQNHIFDVFFFEI